MSRDRYNEALKHHRQGRLSDAARLYREILVDDPAHPQALQHLALLAQSSGRLQEACELLERAVACDPDDAAVHNNLANVLRALRRTPEAVASYKAALARDPDYINAHFNLATLLMEADDPRGAAHGYREVLRLAPGDADAVGGLGVAMMAAGSTREAIDCFRRALNMRPDDPVAHYNLATALKDEGDPDAALELYRGAVALDRNYAAAYNNIGLLLKIRGETEDAAGAFNHAIRSDPRHIQSYLNFAGLLLAKGDFTRAEELSRRALALDARHCGALQSLGAALTGLRKFDDAERALSQALEIDSELSDARLLLGQVYEKQVRLADAIMQYRAIPAHSASYPFAQNHLGVCLMNQGRIASARAAFERALDADSDYVECHSNILFCSNYEAEIAPSTEFALHRAWARRHAAGGARAAPKPDLAVSRRLRIGYVSPDFCTHPVASFIEPLIAGRDRERFEVICYSDVVYEDDTTRRIRTSADHWCDLRGVDHEKAAAIVREDGIDILVDLAGHTAGNRLPMFARRPAPIQVAYLGYPNTTGLDEMDYRITDELADPPGEADERHSEALVRLRGGFLCYAPPPDAPAVPEPPVLSHGHVTFGSFNNVNKVNEAVVAVWSRILSALPGSKLLVKSRQLVDAAARLRLQKLFAEHGIDDTRIELMGRVPNRVDHLQIYSRVDIALDPFPYNGTTTTCEALWMGVPVITLTGQVHRARVGTSLLHHAGLDEFITDSIEAYIDKSLVTAQDAQKLSALRHELRRLVATSTLTDVERAVDSLQCAYRDMWRRRVDSATANPALTDGPIRP